MAKTMLFAAMMLAAAAPAAAAPPAKPTKPTQAQLKDAEDTLSLIVSALNSKDVPQEMKNGLFGCLYQNSLSKISVGASELMSKAKAKLDPKDPTARLLVVARVCGAPLPTAPAGKAAPKGR